MIHGVEGVSTGRLAVGMPREEEPRPKPGITGPERRRGYGGVGPEGGPEMRGRLEGGGGVGMVVVVVHRWRCARGLRLSLGSEGRGRRGGFFGVYAVEGEIGWWGFVVVREGGERGLCDVGLSSSLFKFVGWWW